MLKHYFDMTFPYKCFYTKNVGARLLVMFLQLKIVNPVPTALYQDVTEAVIRHLKYTPKKKKPVISHGLFLLLRAKNITLIPNWEQMWKIENSQKSIRCHL